MGGVILVTELAVARDRAVIEFLNAAGGISFRRRGILLGGLVKNFVLPIVAAGLVAGVLVPVVSVAHPTEAEAKWERQVSERYWKVKWKKVRGGKVYKAKGHGPRGYRFFIIPWAAGGADKVRSVYSMSGTCSANAPPAPVESAATAAPAGTNTPATNATTPVAATLPRCMKEPHIR